MRHNISNCKATSSRWGDTNDCNGVMAPGEAETMGTETTPEIAAQLMGQASLEVKDAT